MSPFIYIIKEIFLFSYQLTGNYGVAIILLSFAISFILLPVFILIEKSKKKDDVVKRKMKPLIDEIKRVYKGQERYYYIKTINRQHNYSSLKSLIPILSLLLQIPFFIAAYQFLEYYEPLKGISFSFIKDLSQADGLFGIINVLPILMTIVNLITVYFYTRYGNGERKQMLILALAFLVLLFNLPAGLVLYWTMNNVFSFFRLFITNPEVFKNRSYAIDFSSIYLAYKKSSALLKHAFITSFILLLIVQLRWAFKYYFDDFHVRILFALIGSVSLSIIIVGIKILYQNNIHKILRIKIKPFYYFFLLFLGSYFYLASKFYFNGENINLTILSLIAVIFLQITGALQVIGLRKDEAYKPIQYLPVVLILLLAYQMLIGLASMYDGFFEISLLHLKIEITNPTWLQVSGVGLLFSFLILPYFVKKEKHESILKNKNYGLFIGSVVFTLGLIFFWKPLLVYGSSPETFDFPAVRILVNNLKIFSISLIMSFLVYFLVPKKVKNVLLFIALFSVVLSFVYSLVIPINLGSLQVNKFSDHNNLNLPFGYFIIEALFLIAVFVSIKWIVKNKHFKISTYTLLVFNLILIFQSIYSVSKSGYFFKSIDDNSTVETKGIVFSKNKQNIVYFLADGFQGWYIDKIMKEEADIESAFQGFTWYPNTISESNYTHSSLPSLFLGFDYSVNNLNLDSTRSTKEAINEASFKFMQKAREKGFSYESTIMHYSDLAPDTFDNYIPFWDDGWKKWTGNMPLGPDIDVWKNRLYENSLFYSIPLFLKPIIYNEGKWFSEINLLSTDDKKKGNYKYSHKPYNFIRVLPSISSSKGSEPNLIYIHDHSLHNPWNVVDDNGVMYEDVLPYENNKWFIERFARWINWMKEEGVYDNTRIVIISDHGATWGSMNEFPDIDADVNFDINRALEINPKLFWRLNALLMVKDFNEKGTFKKDWRLMSNADAPSIVFGENKSLENDSISRTLITNFTTWEGNILHQKKIKIYRQYEVSNNMFDLSNWKRLDKPQLGDATHEATSGLKDDGISDIENETTKPVSQNLIKDKAIQDIIKSIRSNPEWLDNVKAQAKDRGVSLDSMMVLSALYVIEVNNKPKKK